MISSTALRPRWSFRKALNSCFAICCLVICLGFTGCGGTGSGGSSGGSSTTTYPQPPAGSAFLAQSDVAALVQTAATTANSDTMSIAVVDRLGVILAVWQGPHAPATVA